WSHRYDRDLADIFAVQDEIGMAIAGALKVKLAPGALKRYVPSLPAYDACLKASSYMATSTAESLKRARGWLEQATSLDAGWALPHVYLGHQYFMLSYYGIMPAHEAIPLALASTQKALELDPHLPDAHAALGRVAAVYRFDWKLAEQEFLQALAPESV